MSSSNTPFWANNQNQSILAENVHFCAGRDVTARPMADAELIPFDIWTNQVSAIALNKANIITSDECRKILEALKTIEIDFQKGKLKLNPDYEDVHMNIEVFLGKKVGKSLAGKIHSGRSRNDQSATDVRLYMREAALRFQKELLDLVKEIRKLAKQHKDTICPGFSHGQPAMVTTFGHTLLGYVQALLRDYERLNHFFKLVNRCPLGSAAGFGTSWPINRENMAELLGFDSAEVNSLDAVSSRGELESQLAFCLTMVMNHFSQIATDLYFMGHPYIGLVTLDESLCTGSSIMPQKINPDLLEVLRAKATITQGYLHSLTALGSKNLSGYNRDYQWSKYPIFDLINECEKAPQLVAEIFRTLKVNKGKMKELAAQNFLNAVEVADLIARTRGLSFREGYHIAKQIVEKCLSKKMNNLNLDILAEVLTEKQLSPLSSLEKEMLKTPLTIINSRSTLGAASIKQIESHIQTIKDELQKNQKYYNSSLNKITKARQKVNSFQS